MGEIEAIRGHRRGARWAQVTYGVHRRAGAPATEEHPPAWDEDELVGWQLLMTDVGCFTGLTALELHGVPMPPLPDESPVFIALAKDDPRPMRLGVHTSRHIHPVQHDLVRGLRVAVVRRHSRRPHAGWGWSTSSPSWMLRSTSAWSRWTSWRSSRSRDDRGAGSCGRS